MGLGLRRHGLTAKQGLTAPELPEDKQIRTIQLEASPEMFGKSRTKLRAVGNFETPRSYLRGTTVSSERPTG